MDTNASGERGSNQGRVAQSHRPERACAELLGPRAGITAVDQLHDLKRGAENRHAEEHWLGRRIDQIDSPMKLKKYGDELFTLGKVAWPAALLPVCG